MGEEVDNADDTKQGDQLMHVRAGPGAVWEGREPVAGRGDALCLAPIQASHPI